MRSGMFDWAWVDIQDGYAIAYCFDGVLIGTVNEGRYQFHREPNWKNLMELHVFNEQQEYRAIYANDRRAWLERTICDENGKPQYAFDEVLRIVGNRPEGSASENGFFESSEAGRCVVLPDEVRDKGLVVRNYLAFEALTDAPGELNELCYMRDYRFAGFADWKEVALRADRQSV